MRRILDILTSRRTSIALMAFVAVFGALGAWIPQSSLGFAEARAIWQEKNPLVARIADALGLYEIFSSWWFLAALGIFALVLAVATMRMVSGAWRAWRLPGRAAHTLVPALAAEPIMVRARAAGFRVRSESAGRYVLARHASGLWAPSVLHIGMLLSLVWAALLLTLTSSAIADFSQGEVREPGAEYYAVDDAAQLPEVGVTWRFDEMDIVTWPSGGLRKVTAKLSFLGDDGLWEQRTSSVNDPLRIRGHTIYAQPGDFGDAAFLRIIDANGVEHRIRMEFYFVEEGQVMYTDSSYPVGDVAIDGRWDPHGILGTQPLGLRPADASGATPVTLAPGETVSVAGLTVEFVQVGQWARFIVQRSPSPIPLFLGFAIIALGSVMLYAWIPRELVLEQTDEGLRYSWHATRMSRAYLAERDAILGITSDEGEER